MDVSAIIAYEQGELSFEGILDLFSELIRTGTAWTLQGSYGRTAAGMIDSGLIDVNGEIDRARVAELLEANV
jgi:hypothetical protein